MRHTLFSKFICVLILGTSSIAYGLVLPNAETIYASNQAQTFDLTGRDGFHGRDGADAFGSRCIPGIVSRGRNGEDGEDGERGEAGKNAIVFFDSLSDLNKITLYQQGGLGGKPGLGGKGATGCNGGYPGKRGKKGKQGQTGAFGSIFLLEKDSQFQKVTSSKVIPLLELYHDGLTLGQYLWTSVEGAENLFSSKSIISNTYYLYDQTRFVDVKLIWSAPQEIQRFSSTKMALSISGGDLKIRSYTGAILDYRVIRNGDVYYLEVLNAISQLELKNLSFGRMKRADDNLILEVKEKYRPVVDVRTSFVVSLYKRNEAQFDDEFIGQFTIRESDVDFKNKKFILHIGRLNFPAEFKKNGTKLRVHLSIYREAKRQRRVLVIKGLFKI